MTQQPLIICPASPKAKICGDNWQRGWNIFTENQQLLRHFDCSSHLPIEWQDLRRTNQIKLLPDGTTEGSNGTFYYGNVKLVINRGGRARVEEK